MTEAGKSIGLAGVRHQPALEHARILYTLALNTLDLAVLEVAVDE